MALSKPSRTDPVYTPGTARGAKLAALLVDEGTARLREMFEQEIKKIKPPTSLREQLKKHGRYLCGLRYLNPGQRRTLYPPGCDVPNTARGPGFDISLLGLLLNELCRNAPKRDARNKLRDFRNKYYGHKPSTDLIQTKFDTLWKELSDILEKLGVPKDRISQRYYRSIDPEREAEYFDLLERLYMEEMEVKHFLDNLGVGQDSLKEGQAGLKEGQAGLKEGQDGLKEGQDGLKEGQGSLKEGQGSLKEGQGSLKEGQDSLKEGQDNLRDGQDSLRDGQDSLREGQGSLKEGQGSLKEGQDSLKEGQGSLKEGQGSLKEGQGSLKEGQGSLKEGQDSLKKGQAGLKEGQDSLKEGQEDLREGQDRILEHLLSNQSPGASTKPCAESSCQTDQMHAGLSDLANDVIDCLKDLYATEYAHVRPLPWCEDINLHLGEVYTNLRLQQRDGRGHFMEAGTIVSLADIYKASKGGDSQVNVRSTVRKIRVEGDPGIGKSCSCQKLAYDWTSGRLDRFKVVFFLEMRHLAGKVKYAIFEQLLPKDTKVSPDQLWSYIQENQDDVLFILDGLDELSQTAREVTDVVDLIQGKILRNCHVLVTSRPYHCVKDLEKCHQFYKIIGYSKENSEEFIHRYFWMSPESASQLVEQLQRNNNLSEIAVNPLNNVLICVVWEDNNEELPSSKDELYEMIVHSVAKKYCTRIDLPMEGDKFPPDIEEALRGLEELSWEGLEQEQLQFDIDEITKKNGTTADNMLNMGLLTRDYSFSRIKRTCYCAFLHKTFQEYMAARYISGLVMDGSSREEGMKCVCRLIGMSDASVVNRELVVSCYSKYGEIQNWLLLILGENSRPLFERFAEELSKAQTDEDREYLSFLCIRWLGINSAGSKMAEIVAPCLSDHVTNNLDAFHDPYFLTNDATGEHMGLEMEEVAITNCLSQIMIKTQRCQDDNTNWCVGLAHALTFHKKLSVSHSTGFIQHLTINCELATQQDKLGVLENALSDYDKLRSVTLLEIGFGTPSLTFIPRCGAESVVICNIRRPLPQEAFLVFSDPGKPNSGDAGC
ncbi:uncharacterized protein [Branchiostoma lanceolatum]|uniref:uncharacterized protein n=1 Tax=Branchiostoma lanceolatum TaxID=7740 RepID=UPI00345364A1